MKRTLSSLLLLTICFCSIAVAQDDASDRTRKALADAAKNGTKLRIQNPVNGNVNVQAVLLPRVDARRIFGSEIGNNYAVVELNIGNKSPDAALIIHGVFIDYRDWPLSGASGGNLSSLRSPDPYQASAFPNQVASAEYRVVRGQLLDAQTDTLRNRFLRLLTLAGNLAGAFTFSLNEQGIVKGIAAATGVGIPGVATAWPDKTVDQLNRISDFGFRANKVVPKESSEVIVCFFPIDRFLTRGFRNLFLKSPALFFAPLLMLADKVVKPELDAAIGELLVGQKNSAGQQLTADDLRAALPCFMTIEHPKPDDPAYPICLSSFGLEKDPTSTRGALRVKVNAAGAPIQAEADKFKIFMILEFVGNVSLNKVVITVDGVMSVDVKMIAARIEGIDVDKLADCGDADGQCSWRNVAANGGVRTGVIRGAYLSGGKVVLPEQEKTNFGIEDMKVIDEASNDNELHFSFKLTKPVPNQTKLHFTVVKEEPSSDPANPKKLESNSWEYLVAYSPSTSAISSVALSGTTLTVKGSGFTSPAAGASPMTVTLQSKGRTESPVQVPAGVITFTSPSEFSINLSGLGLTAGCWYVQVKENGLTSNRSDNFPVNPAPTLDSATHNGKFIFLKGDDLVDVSNCGGDKISFQLNPTGGGASIPLTVEDWGNGEPVLRLPEAAKTGAWKVEVLVNGSSVAAGAVTADLTANTP